MTSLYKQDRALLGGTADQITFKHFLAKSPLTYYNTPSDKNIRQRQNMGEENVTYLF